MAEAVVTPDPSLADYIRTENAKERAVEAPLVESAVTGEAEKQAASTETQETTTATPIESKIEATTEDADRNPDGTFKAKTPKVSNTGEWARNRRLTAELAQERAERARIEQELAQTRTTTAPAQPTILDPSDPEPTIDQFLDKPDPYAALAVAAGKWAVREERRVSQIAEAQQAAREAQATVAQKITTFAAAHPDYHEAVAAIDDIQFAREALTAIADDDEAPAVAYHLAKHPEEARRIATLTPLGQVKAIGQILARLTPAPSGSGSAAPSISRAKPLIKPVSGSPTVPEGRPPDDLPFGARYIREMNAKERRDREGLRGA